MNETNDKSIEALISIGFQTQREAKIAFNCLRIDSEINSNNYKNISFNNNYLEINLKTKQLKQMRVCLKSILQLLDLSMETMDCFAIEDMEDINWSDICFAEYVEQHRVSEPESKQRSLYLWFCTVFSVNTNGFVVLFVGNNPLKNVCLDRFYIFWPKVLVARIPHTNIGIHYVFRTVFVSFSQLSVDAITKRFQHFVWHKFNAFKAYQQKQSYSSNSWPQTTLCLTTTLPYRWLTASLNTSLEKHLSRIRN